MSALDRILDLVLDSDTETKERIKKAWRILKAFILASGGVDLQIQKGKNTEAMKRNG